MFQAIVIQYSKAFLLAEYGENICVYDPSSDNMFNFKTRQWSYHGSPTARENLARELGNSGMDNNFKFV